MRINGLPVREANIVLRGREYLDETEVRAMSAAASTVGRHRARDSALIWLAYRHALRVSEVCALRWSQVNMRARTLYTLRSKGGNSAMHPLLPEDIACLTPLQAPGATYVFGCERGGALKPDAVRKLVKRAGALAGLEVDVHPHMLRHAAGYELMRRGLDLRKIQAYLGHVSLASTERYTALMPDAFTGIWDARQ
jgi:site-specific recombinase XerD